MSAGAPRDPRTVDVVRLVAARELTERLRAKTFYVLTGVLVALMLAIGVGNRFIDDGPSTIRAGVTGPRADRIAAAAAAFSESIEREAEIVTFADRGAADAALDDGDVSVVVDSDEQAALFADEVDDEVMALLQQAWATVEVEANLSNAGLTPDEIASALTPRPLVGESIDADSDHDGLAMLTGFLAAILLLISLQTFGGYVLTGVVEEKSTAVVELLLARVRADQLLAGKVLGIGAAALLQFAAAIAASLASLAISGTEVPGAVWSAVPATLLWFVGGYALYSMLFALAGSLVSRQEDAQAASAPILTALIAAYMLVFVLGSAPGSLASRILSVLPPTAPLLMPMRIAAGEASILEVSAAVVLLVAAIWGVWKLTGRIYSQVLLRRGSRISWGDALAIAAGRS